MLDYLIPSLSLFQSITSNTLKTIISTSKIKSFRKNTFLNTDHAHSYFAYILKGHVKIFKETVEGKETVLDILAKQHFFGEDLCFEEHPPCPCIQCIDEVDLIIWPTSTVKRLLHEEHQLCLNFLKHKIHKQYHLENNIEHLTTKNAEQRIGNLLLNLVERADQTDCSNKAAHATNHDFPLCSQKNKNSDKIVFKLPYDKSLIAAQLNMRPETFTREIQKLCANCDMELKGSTLFIDSLDPLRQTVAIV